MPQAAGERNPDPARTLDAGTRLSDIAGMAAEKTRSEQRRARLAKALKANIGRRKDQARRRSEPEEPEDGDPPGEDHCRN